jgi:hypothetical protein
MGRSLEATLRARGASAPLLQELEDAGMLSARALAGIATRSIGSRRRSVTRASAGGRGSGSAARTSRRVRGPAEPAPSLQLLAAIALSYL